MAWKYFVDFTMRHPTRHNVSNNRRQILQSEEGAAQGLASWLIVLCTPGMGMN